ncbi:DivIVA domain-containing protein [Nocardia sp. NPDC051570]|uniref:DivIVA domain-containing protein n=1 Tax=Nocardia sp. NPDC051570 TaxID=3364324 RepID=UPI00379B103C
MTPDEMRRMRFDRAPFGHRGYDAAEVDAFCERIAQTYRGGDAPSAAQIRGHEFATAALGHRGYDRDAVDEFLDRACVELEFARRGAERHPAGEALLTPEDVRRLRFSRPPHDHAGYAADEVDVFLDRITTTLAHIGPNGLTSEDVRAANFGLAHAGMTAYSIEEVDSFLDVVVRTLRAEENTRETAPH